MSDEKALTSNEQAIDADQLCKRCRHSYAQHIKGVVHATYCRHCACPDFIPYSLSGGLPERLRAHATNTAFVRDCYMLEAADEIERLQRDLRDLREGDERIFQRLRAFALNVAATEERCSNLQRFPNGCGECLYCQATTLLPGDSSAPETKGSDPLTPLYDLYQIGEAARTPQTLMVNVQNSLRRGRCLTAIEDEFLSRLEKDEDDESDEGIQMCPLSWGAEPEKYVEQFRAEFGGRFAQETGRDERPPGLPLKVPPSCPDCGVPFVAGARHFSGCKSHPGEPAVNGRTE